MWTRTAAWHTWWARTSSRGAVISDRYTTVNLVRTIEAILGLSPSSLNSAAAAPMSDVFDPFQTTWTYNARASSLLTSQGFVE